MIDFNRTFGRGSTNVQSNGKSDDRPKAQYWLNIGFESNFKDEDGSYRFVSLPQGIPLDTQERLPVPRNREFAAFQAARNDVLDQLLAAAKKLAPGEAKIICLDENTGLAVQLRRVNEEAEEIPADQNPFVRKLAIA